MAEISQDSGGKKKGGKKRSHKQSTRIDFTPMVDLGFLLITFFMLTTTMLKPQTMELAMPSKDKPKDPPKKKPENMVTILIDKGDRVFYYTGMPNEKGEYPTPTKASFDDKSPTSLRVYLIDKNSRVTKAVSELEHLNPPLPDSIRKTRIEALKKQPNLPFVVIKATDGSTYKNLVNVLDEMLICNIASYGIDDISKEEIELIKKIK